MVIQEMRPGNCYCPEKERRNKGEKKDFPEKMSSKKGRGVKRRVFQLRKQNYKQKRNSREYGE